MQIGVRRSGMELGTVFELSFVWHTHFPTLLLFTVAGKRLPLSLRVLLIFFFFFLNFVLFCFFWANPLNLALQA